MVIVQYRSSSGGGNVLVALGEFNTYDIGIKRTVFRIFKKALVPNQWVSLDNDRIYKIFITEKHTYVVIYETENIDYYVPYLTKIPQNAREIKELWLPKCPECGSLDVEIDADEMVCNRCGEAYFWNTETVWKAKELPSEKPILRGEGVYIIDDKEYMDETEYRKIISLKKIEGEITKLGNVLVKRERFIGCVEDRSYPSKIIRYYTGIYERYTALDFNKTFVMKISDIPDDSLVGR